MKNKETTKRCLLFLLGLFFSGIGVAFTRHGELGVSPVSSVANILSYRFPALTMGTWLIIWNCVLILGQILILRKRFQLYQLLQIPLSFLFGWFTDFGLFIASFIPVSAYPMRLFMVLSGITILGFGIALSVIANVILNAGEAFVKAIADTVKKDFGSVKTIFDVSCVSFSIVLSLILFPFTIVGTREGTILSALLTGVAVKLFLRLLREPLNAMLTGSSN